MRRGQRGCQGRAWVQQVACAAEQCNGMLMLGRNKKGQSGTADAKKKGRVGLTRSGWVALRNAMRLSGFEECNEEDQVGWL
eukprot:1156850-Pelagomonas_calceolata.AAC.12